jgi:predicted amidohydrolase
MRIGWIQSHPRYGALQENLDEARRSIGATRADLWVLPELFSTGYVFGSRDEVVRLAEPIPGGPTTQALLSIARERGCALVAGLPEAGGEGRFYNSAVAVDPGGLRAVYRKVHLFDHEKEWFDPGDRGFPVVELAGARVGILICFDWRFPEAARTLALAGAQILAHPSNLVLPYCQAAMVTRAIENRVFAVTANRIGTEERAGLALTFTGASQTVAPDGEILAIGPVSEPASGVAEIDPRQADEKRINRHNDLFSDRRTGFYSL